MKPLYSMLTGLIKTGTLIIIDWTGKEHVFAGAPGPTVRARLHDPKLPLKIFRGPEMAVGEAYMDGTLTFEGCNVYDFLYLFSINRQSLGSYPFQVFLRRVWKLMRGIQQYNPVGKAQENVAHHYDLSRELYELFLDEDMQYSCAYFENDDDTLEQAQLNKKRHIAAKLLLKPGQKVLEMGCGWGGLALYMGSVADVEVTGVTLSIEQLKVARERAEKMGLADRVKFELLDYRKVEGQFDRVVAIGLFEHVGVNHYAEFFTQMRSLLAPDGVALFHSIGRMSPPGSTSPWLRKYIFPGGYAPALSEVFQVIEKHNLWVTDMEILRLHYAKTCHEWYLRTLAHREEIIALYDERFFRMWEFYLAAVEMTFVHASMMVFQMQLAHKRDAVPLTRDYITDYERELARTK